MRRVVLGLLLILLALPAYASKDVPFQTITYPEGATPVLRLTFSKFKTLDGGLGKEHPCLTDATAENLAARILNDVNLTLYVFDKTHARIGDGIIYLANVRPGEVVKFQITLNASGVPASVTVVGATPRNTTISVTVNSVPQGATFRLDGKEIGQRQN